MLSLMSSTAMSPCQWLARRPPIRACVTLAGIEMFRSVHARVYELCCCPDTLKTVFQVPLTLNCTDSVPIRLPYMWYFSVRSLYVPPVNVGDVR